MNRYEVIFVDNRNFKYSVVVKADTSEAAAKYIHSIVDIQRIIDIKFIEKVIS